MTEISEQLKQFSYIECVECGSRHRMEYKSGCYECEKCNKKVDFNKVKKNKMRFDWDCVKQYILFHKTPKKVIKILIAKLLKLKYKETDISGHFETLVEDNRLFGE